MGNGTAEKRNIIESATLPITESVSDAMKERQLAGSMGLLETIYKGGCQDDLLWGGEKGSGVFS